MRKELQNIVNEKNNKINFLQKDKSEFLKSVFDLIQVMKQVMK